MDQDFHYYGTYHAAKTGGFDTADATLIARAANFIDFFNETTYAAYWKLVSDTQKTSNYNVVASMDNPRYTFQIGMTGQALAPEDGLWCSYHFTPGNYADPSGTPTREAVHGTDLAGHLSPFVTRDTNGGKAQVGQLDKSGTALEYGMLLNRPQSALSRQMIMDTIQCATDDNRLVSILRYAAGGDYILQHNRDDNLRRFKLILLGVRAHVIADTWAHQDFSGINNVLNTYWDVNYDPKSWNPANWGYGRQSIDYDDGTTSGWKNQVLSSTKHSVTNNPWIDYFNGNLEGAPPLLSYLGHGWMGHLPDFSFVKYRYRPCWADPTKPAIERDNPTEYKQAWLELVSLFTQANGHGHAVMNSVLSADLAKATQAITTPSRLADQTPGRAASATAWQSAFNDAPAAALNVVLEPDPAHAVLDGMIEAGGNLTRYGSSYVNVTSDLYLFQIAADYHFHFVKYYLELHGIYRFTGSWSKQASALSPNWSGLFAGMH